jgi:hypothetical protein
VVGETLGTKRDGSGVGDVEAAWGTLLTELNYYDIEVVIPESETLWARFWGQA